MTEVWICESGDLYEGGGVVGVYASREAALAWINARHAEDTEHAVEMMAYSAEAESADTCKVTPISDEPEKLYFESPCTYYSAKLWQAAEHFTPPCYEGEDGG